MSYLELCIHLQIPSSWQHLCRPWCREWCLASSRPQRMECHHQPFGRLFRGTRWHRRCLCWGHHQRWTTIDGIGDGFLRYFLHQYPKNKEIWAGVTLKRPFLCYTYSETLATGSSWLISSQNTFAWSNNCLGDLCKFIANFFWWVVEISSHLELVSVLFTNRIQKRTVRKRQQSLIKLSTKCILNF